MLSSWDLIREYTDTGIFDVGMGLFQLREEEYPDWDRFVGKLEEGTIYHLSFWKKFLEDTFPHIKGVLLVVREKTSGEIMAGIPLYFIRSLLLGNRVVSTPFATLGGILTSPAVETKRVWATVFENAPRWGGRLEIRGVRNLSAMDGLPLSPSKKHLHHFLELPSSIEELSSNFSRVVRRNLAKADKARVSVQVYDDISPDILRDFSLTHQLERKRLGLPAFPMRFFAALNKHLPYSYISILVAVRNSEILGMLLTLEYQKWSTSEYIALNDQGREFGVSQLLYRESMRRSIATGKKYYSMGRTSIDNYGLLRFKRSWGAIEESLTTFSCPFANSQHANMPLARMIKQFARFGIRSLPLPFAQAVGAFVYSHWA